MSEKTEPPSQKRIEDAHKKGNYLFSREIASGAQLIAITAALGLTATSLLGHLLTALQTVWRTLPLPLEESLPQVVKAVFVFAATTTAVVSGVGVLVALIANIAQTGPVFSFAKLTKGAQALNFINNAKQLFSWRSLFNFGLNIVKVVAIAAILTWLLRDLIPAFIKTLSCGFSCLAQEGVRAMALLFALVGAFYVPVAILDYIFQRYFYLKELRMTKEEVKNEYKEMEGNPEIKSHRKQIHQEVLNSSMMERVKTATMVVKNPTRYAVALLYDEDKTPLPQVVGKGEGALAQAILKTAEAHGVPIYQNVRLAQTLYEGVEIGHYITSEFIEPVVEALQYIETLKR